MTEVKPVKIADVLLTGEDAQVFMAFKMNREKFLTLLQAGVFDLPSGQVEVNINNGVIQNIHIHRLVYKRGG